MENARGRKANSSAKDVLIVHPPNRKETTMGELTSPLGVGARFAWPREVYPLSTASEGRTEREKGEPQWRLTIAS